MMGATKPSLSIGRATPPTLPPRPTVNKNRVKRVSPPPVPTNVIVNDPVGVVEDAVTVSVLVKLGWPDAGLKVQVAPEGRPPVHERLTLNDVPFVRVATTLLVPEPPCWRIMLLELFKSKSDPTVNHSHGLVDGK